MRNNNINQLLIENLFIFPRSDRLKTGLEYDFLMFILISIISVIYIYVYLYRERLSYFIVLITIDSTLNSARIYFLFFC